MRNKQIYFLFFIIFLQFSCTRIEDFKVLHQVTGGIETNCYLIYGVRSKEAALIDPGGNVDSLITFIKNKNRTCDEAFSG